MPLRRRPSQPSPRLRALLEGARPTRSEGPVPTGPEVAAPTGPERAGGSHPPERSSEVVPWLPERSWLERPAATSPDPVPDPRADAAVGARPGAPADAAVDAQADGPERAPEARAVPRPGRHRRARPPGPRLLTVPESLRGARVSAPRLAVVGLLFVLAVAAVGFGARVAWARAASQPHVVAPARHGTAVTARGSAAAAFATGGQDAARAGPSADAPSGSVPGAGQVLTVHVVGQVRHPGVLRLPAGSRVADAVERAGGATAHADLSAINLARPLVDGEQVQVPKPGEAVTPAGGGGAEPGASRAAPGAAGTANGLVNLNTASQADLEELPGVGPVLAQRILDWRTEHGRFTTVDELGEVSGIGDKTFAQLQPKVTV
jgi:competence protein ComEA